MSDHCTDREIIALVLTGQKNSFSVLVRRYQQGAYKMALVLLQHPPDAEDAVSEAFCKAFAALRNCRDETNFKSWFMKITYNCCMDILRKRKRLQNFADLDIIPDTAEAISGEALQSESPLDTLLWREEKDTLLSALSKLNYDDRTALLLKYCHDYSYREIGEILRWPQGTVASRLFRARETIRRYLERRTEGDRRQS